MDFINIAKQRHSVRSYTNQKVEPEKLEQILEAAHVAPTAANLQPVHLLVVQSEEGLAKISKAAGIYGAPLAWQSSCAPITTRHGHGLSIRSRAVTSTLPF